MIAIACRTEGTLAKTPWQLYREIYEVLLHQRAQKKGIDEPLTREQKHRVLLTLAADMMERRQIELEEEQIKQAIRRRVRQLKIDQDVLRYLESATGLIARVGADRWMFTHKTFMEYLAACRWSAERADPDWPALIGDSWWFNALRFYAAMEFATPIAEACFAKNTVPALALAADCLDAAPSSEAVDEPARRRLNELLTAGLESDDPQRRRLAARSAVDAPAESPAPGRRTASGRHEPHHLRRVSAVHRRGARAGRISPTGSFGRHATTCQGKPANPLRVCGPRTPRLFAPGSRGVTAMGPFTAC